MRNGRKLKTDVPVIFYRVLENSRRGFGSALHFDPFSLERFFFVFFLTEFF